MFKSLTGTKAPRDVTIPEGAIRPNLDVRSGLQEYVNGKWEDVVLNHDSDEGTIRKNLEKDRHEMMINGEWYECWVDKNLGFDTAYDGKKK